MRRAAKTGIVVAGAVAVGLAGAITLNATQTSSSSNAGAASPATVSASSSAPTTAATPSATASAPTPNASAGTAAAGAAPSTQAAVPAPPVSATPDAPVPGPAAPVPGPTAPVPAPAAPAPAQQGLDQRIKDSCTARLQSDAAHSSIVTGTVVPRPFTVVSIAFSGNPVPSTSASGLASHDILMNITLKLADGPAQDSERVCRVHDSDSLVDWLPAG